MLPESVSLLTSGWTVTGLEVRFVFSFKKIIKHFKYNFPYIYRLHYEKIHHDQEPLLNSLLACPRLERLVLIDGYMPNDQLESLYQFVKNMKHLVAFCFVSNLIDENNIPELNQKFHDNVTPSRPAFWHCIDNSLISLDERPTVPQIHMDEIVSPVNFFEIPPNF